MWWVVLYPSPLFSTCYHRLQNPLAGVCLKEVWRFDVDAQLWNRLDEPPWNPRRGAIPVVCEGLGFGMFFYVFVVIFLGKGKGEPAYFLHNCLILELDWVSSGEFSVFGTVWGCIYGYMILVLPFWVVHSCRYCPVVSTYGPNWIGSKLDPNFSHLLVVAVWHENPAKSPPVHSWKLMAGTSKSLNWKGK